MDEARGRFTVLCCGRRWGKTEYVLHWLCDDEHGALGGWPVAYVAPTYGMVTEVYATLVDRLAPLLTRHVEGHRLELSTGGVIDLWSMANGGDRMRGRRYRRLAADECAMVVDLMAVWERVMRPTLVDYRGEALFASTPRRGGGFQQLFEEAEREAGREESEREWASYRMPTSSNPHIDPDEIEAARRGSSAQTYAQEYLADFEASESDLVYPEFGPTMVRPASVAWRACKWRVVGIDPGGGDPTAIVPLGVDAREHIHQYGEFYRRGDVDVTDIAGYLAQLGPVDIVAIGETGGNILTNTLQAMGYPAYRADMGRDEGIDTVRWVLQSGRFSLDPGCGHSIREFAGYRWSRRRDPETGDRFATSTPFDHHADAMDARRYAVMALLRAMPGHNGPIETRWDNGTPRALRPRERVLERRRQSA